MHLLTQSLLCAFALLGPRTLASPLVERQATTTSTNAVPAPTTTATGPLIETTVNGKLTTVPIAVPTDSVSTATSTSRASSTGTSSAATPTKSVSEGAPEVPNDVATSCKNSIDQPICQPRAGQQLLSGNTYIVQWSTSAWPTNTSIIIGLQYTNDTTQVAWMSPSYVTQRGIATITIDEKWLEGWTSRNFSLVWNTYQSDASKPQNSMNQKAFDVILGRKPVEHYPPPPQTKLPSKESLLIALPLTLGALIIVAVGLFIGMRSHRHIGLGSVMGRRRGYGSGKSRRERLGLKKGAIRLEDRDPAGADAVTDAQYRDDDEIRAAPRQPAWQTQPGHGRDLSLGSLVGDDEPNAFRREIGQQRTAR